MKLKNRKWNRILKLADFMEKLPRKRFNFAHYVGDNWKGNPDLSCGTTACALGWATTMPMFRRLGLKMDRDLKLPTMVGYQTGGIFGTSAIVLGRLFYPSFSGPAEGYLTPDATPKQWARHARKIVKELNENS